MGRRSFTAEFKRDAVRLVSERGMPTARAAKQVGVHVTVLSSWLREYKADPEHAFPGHGKLKPGQLIDRPPWAAVLGQRFTKSDRATPHPNGTQYH